MKRLLLFICFFCGCGTIPKERIGVPPFILNVAEKEEVQAAYDSIPKKNKRNISILGYWDPITNEVWTIWGGSYDKDGRPLPDFCVLGHEVWHIIKGRWHD